MDEIEDTVGDRDASMKVTVYLRDSSQIGRAEVVKVREDGVQGLKDDVPIAMVRNLRSHWEAMGWAVVDERSGGRPGSRGGGS